MKLAVIVLIASLSLFALCSSLDDDYREPVGDVAGDEPEGQPGPGRVSEEDLIHDPTADQEALLGGKAARKRLTEMPREEALKEIRKLVERIDTDKDGTLDRDEVFAWLSKVEDKVMLDESASVFDKEDTDDDGFITVEEYMRNSGFPDDYAENEEAEPLQEGIRERFNVADRDKDGRLTKEEFEMFVHPDRHEEMLKHLVGEQLSRFDNDKDGKISFDEYMKYYNPAGRSTDDMPEWIVNEQREFEAKLDANRDGFLDSSEIEGWIAPSDTEFITEEVEHLMNDIDENKDGKLSYDEVLDRFDVVVESSLTDYGHTIHDEL